jgi:heterodisulfide reductase subunit A-like polyferredoxin
MGKVGVVLCPCEREGVPRFNPEALGEKLRGDEGVLPFVHHPPVCSEPGMDAIRGFVEANELDRVVVACSARTVRAYLQEGAETMGAESLSERGARHRSCP